MMQLRQLPIAAAATVFFFAPHVLLAAAFPDVPANHPNATAIYDLQKRGIIRGNSDGTFAPDRTLNRAELLTLVYRANGKDTRAIYANCADDVPADAWYSNIVCTAMHDGFVQGYPDGTFRPERDVNVVEALKMILNGMEFTVPKLTQEDRLSIDFMGEVTSSAWYSPYLHRALSLDLVPKVLTANNVFDAGAPLSRALAAEIIYRALNTDDSVPEKSAADAASGMMENNASASSSAGAKLVSFPIHSTGKTGDRGTTAFVFNMNSTGTAHVEARNMTSASAGIQCFLYLLDDEGFSNEFFIGYREGGGCFINGALTPGKYQIEIRSPSEGADYSLDVQSGDGDGNDGFSEAVTLNVGRPRTDTLAPEDYEDWYHFLVSSKEQHRVKISSVSDLSCMLFPSKNVDLSSFRIPRCGETANFEPGDWYISIKKKKNAADSQTYTVELR